MQDPRLRLFAVCTVSMAAFSGMQGAAAALLWWLVCTPNIRSVGRPRTFAWLAAVIIVTGVVTYLAGGSGLDYTLRMLVVLLLATWAYSEFRAGDLLNISVWMFGNRTGFELGLIAEMALETLDKIWHDASRVRMAISLKGMPCGVRTIVPVAANLLLVQLKRSEDLAQLLQVRGYAMGGSLCPEFAGNRKDVFFTLLAIPVAFTALIQVSDIFILIQ